MYRARFCRSLKGQCHGIFDFRFSTWISFPQAPDYSIGAVSNFFENSRRYSQLKVHHRCRWHRLQMEKIFNQKNFHYYFWTPLDSRVSRRCRWYRRQFCPRCRWHRWCTLTCEYLREFSKIFETVLMEYSGLGDSDSWKNQKQKISWHSPCKGAQESIRGQVQWSSVAKLSCLLLPQSMGSSVVVKCSKIRLSAHAIVNGVKYSGQVK